MSDLLGPRPRRSPAASPSGARCWWRPAASTWRTTSSSPSRSRPRSTACAPARNAVVDEMHQLQQTSVALMGPKEAPHELAALLDVHLMLLQDEALIGGVKHWITERLYNAEWALTTQLEVHRAPVRRDGGRVPARAQGRPRAGGRAHAAPHEGHRLAGAGADAAAAQAQRQQDDCCWTATTHRRAAGADRARPVAGRHAAVQAERVRRLRHRRRRPHLAHRHRRAQHGHPGRGRRAQRQPAGAAGRLGHHRRRRRRDDRRPVADHPGRVRLQAAPGRARARPALAPAPHAGRHARRPAASSCWPTSRCPRTRCGAVKAGAVGVGLFRSEFLFMGREAQRRRACPTRKSSTRPTSARSRACRACRSRSAPSTSAPTSRWTASRCATTAHLNPALGLRAIRWSLADPAMFLHPAARHPARRRARRGPPADPHAGARQRDPPDAVADRLRARRAGQPRRRLRPR